MKLSICYCCVLIVYIIRFPDDDGIQDGVQIEISSIGLHIRSWVRTEFNSIFTCLIMGQHSETLWYSCEYDETEVQSWHASFGCCISGNRKRTQYFNILTIFIFFFNNKLKNEQNEFQIFRLFLFTFVYIFLYIKFKLLFTKYFIFSKKLFFNFQDAVHAFSGGLSNTLKIHDINSNTGKEMWNQTNKKSKIIKLKNKTSENNLFVCFSENTIGTHEKPIRKIEYCSTINAIITGSWDGTVKLWDTRSPTCVGTYIQPDTVFALSVCGEKFVVGTAKRKVAIWDLRNMAGACQRRESSLKYQTRCIKGFPNEQVRFFST